jgi:hypothetical protein
MAELSSCRGPRSVVCLSQLGPSDVIEPTPKTLGPGDFNRGPGIPRPDPVPCGHDALMRLSPVQLPLTPGERPRMSGLAVLACARCARCAKHECSGPRAVAWMPRFGTRPPGAAPLRLEGILTTRPDFSLWLDRCQAPSD